MKINKNKGFTLVELLAVIVILGIILGIVALSVVRLLESSKEKAFITSEGMLIKASQNYVLNENKSLPKFGAAPLVISYEEIKTSGHVKKVFDPKTKTECSALIVIDQFPENIYKYTPYLECESYSSTEIRVKEINGCVSEVGKIYYDETCHDTRTSGAMVQDDNGYFVIETAADLQSVDTNTASRGESYILGRNIDLSSFGEFNPIGANDYEFTGKFNGQELTIDDLTINRSTEDYIGLFADMNGAEIKNLKITNASIVGKSNVGMLSGKVDRGSIITNVIVSGDVTSWASNVGGLIGQMDEESIVNLTTSSGTVNNPDIVSDDYNVGGHIGVMVVSTKLYNSSSSVSVTYGGNHVGGLVGAMDVATIDNCFSTGDLLLNNVTANTVSYGGGLVGRMKDSEIRNSYSLSDINAYNYYGTGGLVGRVYDSKISNSYYKGNITAGGNVGSYAINVGGLIGKSEGLELENFYAISDITGAIDESALIIGQIDLVGDTFITKGYAAGSIVADDRSGAFLGQSQDNVNYSYIYSKLYSIADITGDHDLGKLIGQDSGNYTGTKLFSYENQVVTGTVINIVGVEARLVDLSNASWYVDGLGLDDNWLIDSSNTMLDSAGNSVIKPLLYKIDRSGNPTMELVGGQL